MVEGDGARRRSTDHPVGPTGSAVDRRAFVAGAATAGALAWAAPAVISVDAASAQTAPPVVLVATGSSGTIITSPDGVAWTGQTSGTTNNLKGVAWSPPLGLFAAVGSGGTILTSPDGVAWTTRTSPTPRELNAVEWDATDGQFVAVGNARTVVTSTDGITWVLRTAGPLTDPDLLGLAVDGTGTLVAVGSGGVVDRSTDAGATWSPETSGVATDLFDVEWFGDASLFVTVGAAGVGLTSPTGTAWSAVTTTTTNDLVAAEWSDDRNEIVVVDDTVSGGVYLSANGSSWSAPATLGASIKAITFSPSLALYIAVGSSGSAWTGPTATGPWTSQTTPTTQNLLAVVARA